MLRRCSRCRVQPAFLTVLLAYACASDLQASVAEQLSSLTPREVRLLVDELVTAGKVLVDSGATVRDHSGGCSACQLASWAVSSTRVLRAPPSALDALLAPGQDGDVTDDDADDDEHDALQDDDSDGEDDDRDGGLAGEGHDDGTGDDDGSGDDSSDDEDMSGGSDVDD